MPRFRLSVGASRFPYWIVAGFVLILFCLLKDWLLRVDAASVCQGVACAADASQKLMEPLREGGRRLGSKDEPLGDRSDVLTSMNFPRPELPRNAQEGANIGSLMDNRKQLEIMSDYSSFQQKYLALLSTPVEDSFSRNAATRDLVARVNGFLAQGLLSPEQAESMKAAILGQQTNGAK